VASYAVNPEAVDHARELIDKRQYVLESDLRRRPARRGRAPERALVQPLATESHVFYREFLDGRCLARTGDLLLVRQADAKAARCREAAL
jgi:hypothetical protein